MEFLSRSRQVLESTLRARPSFDHARIVWAHVLSDQARRAPGGRHRPRTSDEPGIETAPGEELQVDYGTGPMMRDPQSGKYRRTRLFVLTLGYSRKSVRLLVFRASSQIWAQLREKAFRRLGAGHIARSVKPSCSGCGPLAGFEVSTTGRFSGVHRG